MTTLPWKPLLLAWLAILAIAFGNGALRELWLLPALGPPWAHWISGALLIAAILLVTRVSARHLVAPSAVQRWAIGAIWLVLTLGFEFGMGVAAGHTLAQMLAPYRFTDGNPWPLVLLATVLAPVILLRTPRL
jgi:hypothetical protein